MLAGYIFFVLLCICLLCLFSPVVIRYTKDGSATLTVHFVFFSLLLMKKTATEEKTKADGEKKQRRQNKKDALQSALRYALPRATVSVQALPLPTVEDPFYNGILLGGYHALLALILSLFGRRTDDPLLFAKNEAKAALDVRFQMRFYAFLHTFLVYMAKYRKEKEAEGIHGRNENE